MAVAANSTKSPTKTPKGSKKDVKEVKQDESDKKQSPQTSNKRSADGSPKEEKPPIEHTPLENALFETLANTARTMDSQLRVIKKIFYDNDRDLQLTKKSLKPLKDPEAPKRPASAYLLFQNDMRLKKDPSQTQPQFMSQVGKEWNSIDPAEKEKYNKKYQKSIDVFEQQRDEYVKSGREALWRKKGENEGFSTTPAPKKPAEKKPKQDTKEEKKIAKDEPKSSKATASKMDEKKETAPASKTSKPKKEEKQPEPAQESEESSESESGSGSSESDSSGSGSSESDSSESESEPEPQPEPPKKAAKKESGKKSKNCDHMRNLKHHEQKLLKKVDFVNWKQDASLREIKVMRRYHLQGRDDYAKYNRLCGSMRQMAHRLSLLSAQDPYRHQMETQLLAKGYEMGLLNIGSKLSDVEKISVASFCRRRLAVVCVRNKLCESVKTATQYIEQGHLRVGPDTITDPAFLVTRNMEDFVTWVDTSKIKRTVMNYNDELDDFDLLRSTRASTRSSTMNSTNTSDDQDTKMAVESLNIAKAEDDVNEELEQEPSDDDELEYDDKYEQQDDIGDDDEEEDYKVDVDEDEHMEALYTQVDAKPKRKRTETANGKPTFNDKVDISSDDESIKYADQFEQASDNDVTIVASNEADNPHDISDDDVQEIKPLPKILKDNDELTQEEKQAMADERKRIAALKRQRDKFEIQERTKLKKELGRKTLTRGEMNQVALGCWHPELKDVWGDLSRDIVPQKPQTLPSPPGLKLKLLPFQQESLYWMKEQEKGPWKGGMLADEMGMGKTIQTIALLLSDRKKPNLIVAPTIAVVQWKNEIESYTDGMNVLLWHGASRTKNIADLKKYDVVMTSYSVMESAFRIQQYGRQRKGSKIKEPSPLHAINWHRIILDEAHNIKERSSNTSKAAFGLKSNFKWCLSGTPLQNRVGELYSLVRFIGADPFAYYYGKKSKCKSLNWSFSDRRHCDYCGESPMNHVCFWNNEILTPIQRYGMVGEGLTAFKKLKILLDRMMLRRTKVERADDLGLPPRIVKCRRDFFSEEERDIYLSLYSDVRRAFSSYIDQGTILNNYSNIFSLITRMRQMACHPDLVLKSRTTEYGKDLSDEHVCRICNDIAEDAIDARCHHAFCRLCITEYLTGSLVEQPECPSCHVPISIDINQPSIERAEDEGLKTSKPNGITGRLDMAHWKSSTKIEALVEELTELQREDCTIKSLVFSQFVNFLDLVAWRLKRAGFNICRLEGNMTPQTRNAVVQHFMKNVHCTVFLVSLKAGGVALNLTEASRVYMMDSWWNPAVEYQAMDRVHRLGARRPVQCIKLVIEDSIESRIVQLQEKKSAMVDAAIGRDDAAMGRLSPEDMGFLFKM
ncbi:hypothetical protein E3P92_01431 [Wallemia ichthyophaga]|nr:hypothetical protein E3P91_01174 [Wallemia ichthyophaga]TIB16132.1 hypothetical protein E3P92_01431 [Wallemia ichthyophaga]